MAAPTHLGRWTGSLLPRIFGKGTADVNQDRADNVSKDAISAAVVDI
jgi:hypothetical protein